MDTYHTPVLLQETIEFLDVQSGKRYIDATLGGGGHTEAILKLGGTVLGIDTDEEAVTHVQEKLKIKNEKIKITKGNFRNIDEIARVNGFENVDGILFDLGVSSHQFDSAERGFSFLKKGPLDMRMDRRLGVTAKDLLAVLSKTDLAKLFIEYGEERFAHKIADAIVKRREIKPIESTEELEALIRMVVPKKEVIHPGTRVFQALRIAVNTELENIEEALPKAIELVHVKGRIAVISFHSLEDRIVKRTFADWEENNIGNILTKKPVIPSEKEIAENPRSRSAKLRVFEKI